MSFGLTRSVVYRFTNSYDRIHIFGLLNQFFEKPDFVKNQFNDFDLLNIFSRFRQELNSLKTAHVQSQRYLSDQESQRKHLEARLHAEIEGKFELKFKVNFENSKFFFR